MIARGEAERVRDALLAACWGRWLAEHAMLMTPHSEFEGLPVAGTQMAVSPAFAAYEQVVGETSVR